MFTRGVFIDLEKAFDTVNHQILISKLNHYGIRGVVNKWFSSYLSNRYQMVSLNDVSSPRLPNTCGVLQGSILGPLLFLLYINDMHLAVEHSTIYHFADDTNLLYSCKLLKTLRKAINMDNITDTNRIYFDLKVLNIDHQLQVQLSSLMWDYDHDTLPSSLVHNYSTRTASK